MNKKTLIYLFLIFNLFNIALNSTAQEIRDDPIIYQPDADSPLLTRNPALTGEGEIFDFLIGDWDVVITWQPKEGAKDIYRAKWHNHWVVDGYVVMQEWRGPSLTGAELRYYDTTTQKWTGRNIYVNGAWRDTKARSNGDNLEVTIFGEDTARGKFLNRETYFNITQNSFEMKSDISLDQGKTWERGDYHMIVKRTPTK